MAMPAFQPGDVVHLASGGPSMTVVSVADEHVYCTYFDQEGHLQGGPEGTPFQQSLLKAGAYSPPDEERENSKFGYA